jgi:hypothetical protein
VLVREAIDFSDVSGVRTRLGGKFGPRQVLAIRNPLRGDFVDRRIEIRSGSPPHLNRDLNTLIGIHGPNNLCAGQWPSITSWEVD